MGQYCQSINSIFSIEGNQIGNYDFRCDSFQWMHSIYGSHVYGLSRNG